MRMRPAGHVAGNAVRETLAGLRIGDLSFRRGRGIMVVSGQPLSVERLAP
ncbi:MAG: hypothetical protein JOY71_19825 [Acetobacteraceae bacterium]|nr:hypothetical protein [Acetobacteraceae bacterium]MBV8591203.1 hypothetical protein [Acetobacteraceae bacterium]